MTSALPSGLRAPHVFAAAALAIASAQSLQTLRAAARDAPSTFPSPVLASLLSGPVPFILAGLLGAGLVLFAFRRTTRFVVLGVGVGLALVALLEASVGPHIAARHVADVAPAYLAYAMVGLSSGRPSATDAEGHGVEAALGVGAALLALDALAAWLAGHRLVDPHAVSVEALEASTAGYVELSVLRASFAAQPGWCAALAFALFAGKLGGLTLLVPRARAAYVPVAVLGSLVTATCLGRRPGPALVGLVVLIVASSRHSSDAPGDGL